MKKIIALLFILILCCSCKNAPIEEFENTPIPDRTLIPRATLEPTPKPQYTTFAENEMGIPQMLEIVEGENIGAVAICQSTKYYYLLGRNFKIYQLKKDESGYTLTASAQLPKERIGNEYNYEMGYTTINGETVYFTYAGVIYSYIKNGEQVYEAEKPEDVDRDDYEKIRTRPTKFYFEFSNGEKKNINVSDNKIFFVTEEETKIKTLEVYAGSRYLSFASVKNYVVPESYRILQATDIKIY